MKTEVSLNAIAITPVAGEWRVAINVDEHTILIPFLLKDHARSFAAEHARRLGFVVNLPSQASGYCMTGNSRLRSLCAQFGVGR